MAVKTSKLKKLILRILRKLDNFIDGIRFKMVTATGRGKNYPIKIAPYRGFGSTTRIFIQGRVLVKKSFRNTGKESPIQNIINTYKRFDSNEVMNARLRIEVGKNNYEVLSDQEGYFVVDQQLESPLPVKEKYWQKVKIHLLETPWRSLELTKRTKIMVPPASANLGIITDIDDTILYTGVTSPLKWRVIYNTFFKSAINRKAFDEAAAFFRAIHRNDEGKKQNPVFYLSNSPHNLYEMLRQFLKFNDLPRGPILLRDIGIPYRLHQKEYESHKVGSIKRVLRTYPDMPFILIGDSGEKDLYIYHEIANEFPDRISAIFIRDVLHRRRIARISEFIKTTNNDNIKVFKTYRELARFASNMGFMTFNKFEQIKQELNNQ